MGSSPQQLRMPPAAIVSKVNCCQRCSLCCCRCCLAFSLIFAIGLTATGGFLVYTNKSESLVDVIEYMADPHPDIMENRAMWKSLGIGLLVCGAIMAFFVIISSAFVCCLTATKQDVATVYVTPPAAVAPSLLPGPQGPTFDSSTYSKATAPPLGPPPPYPPPCYENLSSSLTS